jgi:hypothetical protein
MTQPPLVGKGFLVIEASRSHSDTPKSVVLLWTSDHSEAETSAWQHTTLTRDKLPRAGGVRTCSTSKRAAAEPRSWPCGHWDRQSLKVLGKIYLIKNTVFYLLLGFFNQNIFATTDIERFTIEAKSEMIFFFIKRDRHNCPVNLTLKDSTSLPGMSVM